MVDRINQLNLSMKNKKSVFFQQHSVIHMLLLYLVMVLLFLNLVFSGVLLDLCEKGITVCILLLYIVYLFIYYKYPTIIYFLYIYYIYPTIIIYSIFVYYLY